MRFFWFLVHIILCAPTLLLVLPLAVLFTWLTVTQPYVFRTPAYVPQQVIALPELTVDVQYPDHLKSGARAVPVYIQVSSSITTSQPVLISLGSSDKQVKLVPYEKSFGPGAPTRFYSETQISIQYLPSLAANSGFALTMNVAGPIRTTAQAVVGVDGLTTRIAAWLSGAGTVLTLLVSLMKLLGKGAG